MSVALAVDLCYVFSQEHGNRKMEFSDLVFGQTIGSGATGTVFKGGWKELDVAIKTVVYNDRVREEV